MMKRLKILAIRMSILMVIYSGLRFGFWLYHRPLFQTHSTPELLFSFVHGLRFDIAALCWINAVFLILAFIPHALTKVERALFIGINAAFVIASTNDFELFTFNGKRLSREFFTSLGEDFWQQLPQVFLHYWYLPLAGVLAGIALWKGDAKIEKRVREQAAPTWLKVTLIVVLPILTFIGVRGGLQRKSIQVMSAFTQGANELGHLTINTPYHFLRTFTLPTLKKRAWFSAEELVQQMESTFPSQNVPGQKNDNVVLLILESFSLEAYEEGYMPFLKELAERGAYFPKNFANGRRSIEALSSLIDGVPSVLDVPFSKSGSQGMPLQGVATRLRDTGYATAFLHGAGRGSMGFEAYALSHGFQRYHAREDYDGSKDDFDGSWGIFDGPWLDYSLREMNKLKAPFFVGIFTLSSHQPYAIPGQWQGKFSKGNLEIHESLGYTDQMLREFFAKAAREPWFKNTLFVITADHTQKLRSEKFQNSLGVYRVPLILFHPTFKLSAADKVTQHVDVPASILDWVDVPATGLNLVGESVLAPGTGKALHYLQPGWQYIKGDRVFSWKEDEAGEEFVWSAQTGKLEKAADVTLEAETKLLIQYLMNGFQQNRWPLVRRE